MIDSDYQDQLFVSVCNRGSKPFRLTPSERSAQLIVVPVTQEDFNIVDDFATAQRGTGRFGSTGRG